MILDLTFSIIVLAALVVGYYAGKVRAVKGTPKLLARMTVEEWRDMAKLVADHKARLDQSEVLRQLESLTAEYTALKAENAKLKSQPVDEVAV